MSVRLMAAAVLIVGCGGAVQTAPPRPTGTARTDLQRHDLSIPGREVFQARVDFAPAASFPRHKHPGEEIIYVHGREQGNEERRYRHPKGPRRGATHSPLRRFLALDPLSMNPLPS